MGRSRVVPGTGNVGKVHPGAAQRLPKRKKHPHTETQRRRENEQLKMAMAGATSRLRFLENG